MLWLPPFFAVTLDHGSWQRESCRLSDQIDKISDGRVQTYFERISVKGVHTHRIRVLIQPHPIIARADDIIQEAGDIGFRAEG